MEGLRITSFLVLLVFVLDGGDGNVLLVAVAALEVSGRQTPARSLLPHPLDLRVSAHVRAKLLLFLLDPLVPVGLRIPPDLRNDLDSGGLVGSVGHGPGHLLVSERLSRVRPERELRPEDSLTLESGSLTDEEMIEVALERLLVDVEDFAAQVQAQGSVRPAEK